MNHRFYRPQSLDGEAHGLFCGDCAPIGHPCLTDATKPELSEVCMCCGRTVAFIEAQMPKGWTVVHGGDTYSSPAVKRLVTSQIGSREFADALKALTVAQPQGRGE